MVAKVAIREQGPFFPQSVGTIHYEQTCCPSQSLPFALVLSSHKDRPTFSSFFTQNRTKFFAQALFVLIETHPHHLARY